MSDEMQSENTQEVQEQNISETNTETTEVQTETKDNSEEYDREQISKALDEPENVDVDEQTVEPPEETKKDNTVECPDKFKNEDGTVNIEKALKSYKDLESNSSKKEAEWQKEKAELLEAKKQLDEINKANEQKAIQAGYQSVQDMNDVLSLASIEANEYAKYLSITDDPETVKEMLEQYMSNPDPELMEEIELEFPPEVNKRVAVIADRSKQELINNRAQYEQNTHFQNIENIISASVEKNSEIFNYEPFKNMFLNALQRYGDNFTVEDAGALIDTMTQMKDLLRVEFKKEYNIKKENDSATDRLSSFNSSANPASKVEMDVDIDSLSPSELAKEIRKHL